MLVWYSLPVVPWQSVTTDTIEGEQNVVILHLLPCFLVEGQTSKICPWLEVISVSTIKLPMDLALFSL